MEYDKNTIEGLDWLFNEWETATDDDEREDIKRDIKALLQNNPYVPLQYHIKAQSIIS